MYNAAEYQDAKSDAWHDGAKFGGVIGVLLSLIVGLMLFACASSGKSYRDYERDSQFEQRRVLELEKLKLEVERLRRHSYDVPV